jgi:DNA-binding response OmpR family regulator
MPGREQTLLVVSPDEEDQRLFRSTLKPDGWKIQAASSYAEALHAVKRITPAVIACEGMLPDGSWRDLLVWLDSLDSAACVIVLSRQADERLWAEVLNLGGYDLLAKPLVRSEVSRVVNMAFRYGRGSDRPEFPGQLSR